MNRTIFGLGGFPLEAETFEFLQDSYELLQQLTQLGEAGDYILNGVQLNRDETNTYLSDGHIVYSGELLPFVGGAFGVLITQSRTLWLTLVEDEEVVPYEDDGDGDGNGDLALGYKRRYIRIATPEEIADNTVTKIDYYTLTRFSPTPSVWGIAYIPVGFDQVRPSVTGDLTSIRFLQTVTGGDIYRISFPQLNTTEYTPIIENQTTGILVQTIDYNVFNRNGSYFDILIKSDPADRRGHIYNLLIQIVK